MNYHGNPATVAARKEAAAKSKPNGLRGEALRSKIRERPDWAAKSLLGVNLWDKQNEILRNAFAKQRLAVAGCVSSGKTLTAAALTFLWLYGWGPGSRVFTLAPSYRQVNLNLWGEIPRIHRTAPRPLGGKMYDTTEFKLGPDWYALGFSTKEPELIHGIHGPHDLVIVDDAHAVPEQMFEELENVNAGGQAHIVLLYNSHRLSGTTFHARHRDRKLWNPMTISYFDTPNGKAGKVVLPGTLAPEVVAGWEKKYGKASNFYRVKVLAQDPKQEADTLIPLDWLELARLREVPKEEGTAYGQDVARFGDDDSVRCELEGRRVIDLVVRHGHDTVETAHAIMAAQATRPGPCAIDVIGVGSGTYDRCAEDSAEVLAVNSSEASTEVDEVGKKKFANLRSELWWKARESFDPQNKNPDDLMSLMYIEDKQLVDDLVAELSCVRYRHTKQGIQVEPKEGETEKWGLKKRLGHSCDKADSYIYALHARSVGAGGGDLMTLVEEEYA